MSVPTNFIKQSILCYYKLESFLNLPHYEYTTDLDFYETFIFKNSWVHPTYYIQCDYKSNIDIIPKLHVLNKAGFHVWWELIQGGFVPFEEAIKRISNSILTGESFDNGYSSFYISFNQDDLSNFNNIENLSQ